tara:strand:- start:382 stop:675 length:294 start_codon:yes stop_codon:yes gene_type:complete
MPEPRCLTLVHHWTGVTPNKTNVTTATHATDSKHAMGVSDNVFPAPPCNVTMATHATGLKHAILFQEAVKRESRLFAHKKNPTAFMPANPIPAPACA